MKRLIAIVGFLVTGSSPLSFASTTSAKIYSVLRSPYMRHARIGISAQILGTRRNLFSYHSSTPLVPASNLKLLVTACALLKLGEDYRFTTTVSGGPMENGILSGNLVLRGGGDPTWSKDFYPESTTPLVILAQKLRESGLRIVQGDLVVDDSIFDRQFTGSGWKSRYQWEDYAAEVGGVSLNKNEVKVSVLPERFGGAPARIAMWPANSVLSVVNRAWTSRGGSALRVSRSRRMNQMVISGALSWKSQGAVFEFNIHNPPLFSGSAFAEILKAQGIQIQGKVRLIRSREIGTLPPMSVLAQIQSPPLLSIIRRLNKESDNFLAEHLFRLIGAVQYGKGSVANASRAVAESLHQLGIRNRGIRMVDGSGLSEENRVSPQMFVDLLQAMAMSPAGAKFRNTLPFGGIDGTLDERLSDVLVQAKTGALQGINSLSGYLVTPYGQTVVFSVIFNDFHFSSEAARNLIDHIVRILGQSKEFSKQ